MALKMTKKETAKSAAAFAIVLAFAVFFYRLFNPADIPALLTYAIFFVLIPSYAAYFVFDKLIDRVVREKKVEVVE